MSDERVFVSYARADGVAAARELRLRLATAGLSVWQDLIALQGGRDWWSQIEAALRAKSLQHVVVVLTPRLLESRVVRQEIRLARQEGKQIHPVRGPGFVLSTLPRWMGHAIDPSLPEQWDLLLGMLRGPSAQNRAPMMAPEPPADFVARPQEFEALKRSLLDDKGDAKGGQLTAITAALRGAGGYGKTTLAKALAHDAEVQEAFYDGVLWVELGERPANLLAIVIDLIQRLTAERPGIESINTAAAALGEALGERRILLIVDDVWNAADLNPFLQGGLRTTRLVTTRLDRVLPDNAFRLPVDAMQPLEAVNLLKTGLAEDQTEASTAEITALAQRLGEWAQLLKLANGFLRSRVGRGEALAAAIENVNRRLDRKGLTAFDAREEGDRTKAVARTIEVSLDLLDGAGRARFGELAVFPEDVDVPIDVADAFWAETAGLSSIDAEDRLTQFSDLSLLVALDFDRRTFRLHDTTRAYLRAKAGSLLVDLNGKLVAALDHSTNPSNALTHYELNYRPAHLAETNDRDALNALLTDPTWIDRKIGAMGGTTEIVSDYERFAEPTDQLQSLVERTLRLTSGILARDPQQRMPQLHGRLLRALSDTQGSEFVAALLERAPDGALIETQPALTPPGPELARLEGHSGSIRALAVLPDGRLASGAADNTIRIWDLQNGRECGCFEGHTDSITALAVLRDGRLASGAADNTIRLWGLRNGHQSALLEGHSASLTVLASAPDGRLISGAGDNAIKLWDPQSGRELACLIGHTGPIRSLAVLPDGRLASGANDNTIRIWDLRTGRESLRLDGHNGVVTALTVLPDGRLASAAADNTIRFWDTRNGREQGRLIDHWASVRALLAMQDGSLAGASDRAITLWDPESGRELMKLSGHGGAVRVLAVLPDGRLASGANDNTVRLWNPLRAHEPSGVEGHGGVITSLSVLPDGRLASGGNDNAIKFWDPRSGQEQGRLEGHNAAVRALATLRDGRLASGSDDKSIGLWDPQTRTVVARLKGHLRSVRELAVLPDGRLVSGSDDNTIRVWDSNSAKELAKLNGHGATITALAILPDGRLVSGSNDKTIRIWDLTAGRQLARIEGHGGWVNALTVLPDGRLASGAADNTIRIWDVETGRECARLDGHSAQVNALLVLPNGRLASGAADNTIRLWDIQKLRECARLEIDGVVGALALLDDGRFVAGDSVGRLHWLAIQSAAAASKCAAPPTRSAIVAPTGPNAQATERAVFGPGHARDPASGPLSWLKALIAIVLVIGVLVVAATWNGQFEGFDARDAVTHLLDLFSPR